VTDHFSGFTWGTTCEDKVQDNLAKFLVDLCLKNGYGAPETLLSDNGGDVTNQLIDRMD
jgi:hypothetical protein